LKEIHFLLLEKEEKGFQSARVTPIVAIGVGVLLWFEPTLLFPVLGAPIAHLLHTLGLLAPSAGIFESMFTAAMVLRWVALALLLAFVIGVERLPLRSLGICKPGWLDVLLSGGITLLAVGVSLGLSLLVHAPQAAAQTQTAQIISTLSWPEKIHLIVQNAPVEELFFRGFLIERVTTLTRRPWLAGAVSFILFVASHFSGSGILLTLAGIALPSLVFVLLYLWRRNIFLCMLAHAISDTVLLFWH
jgi:membrane protease YdiL (CAAX protease family)